MGVHKKWELNEDEIRLIVDNYTGFHGNMKDIYEMTSRRMPYQAFISRLRGLIDAGRITAPTEEEILARSIKRKKEASRRFHETHPMYRHDYYREHKEHLIELWRRNYRDVPAFRERCRAEARKWYAKHKAI